MSVLTPFLALYRRHWLSMTVAILLALITVLAGIGLLTLSGWFLSATALAGFAGLYSFNYLLPAAGVRGSAILRTSARYAERLVSHDATFKVLAHLRVFIFRRLFPLSPGKIAQFRQAELLNRLVADVSTLDHLYLRVLSPLVTALAVIIIVTLCLSLLDITLALTLGGIMLAVLIALPLFFYRLGKPIGKALTRLRSQYRIQLMAWLQGYAEWVVFGAACRLRSTLNQIEQNWLQQQRRLNNLSALSQGLMILASGLTLILILWLASSGVGYHTSPGALLGLFVFATLAAFETLGPVASAFQHLGQVIASAKRVADLMTQEPDVVFPLSTAEKSSYIEATPIDIQIADLSFTYPGQSLPVLQDITLTIHPGEHVALLGHTGCGKSTLLQLLTRAWDAQQGKIGLAGHSIAEYPAPRLRQMVSMVPQRVYLFSATLADNLRLAAPNKSNEQLEHILMQVGLSTLLNGDGLNTWMGEGGRQLSGGELRRLGIARALLHAAPIILLDEPTEGLDAQTEQSILQLLRTECRDRIMIVATHRLTHLEHLDKIYILDNGLLVEQGTHQTLLTRQGHYARFYQHNT